MTGERLVRRIFPVPAGSGECPFTEPTTAAQPWRRQPLLMVESECGAVAVGRTYLLPPLSSGGASLVRPWLRFHTPLIGRAAGHVAIGLDVAPGANTQVVGSVADRAVLERAFTDYGIEAVVHAAALHKPDIARYHVSAFINVNVTGTLNLLETAVAASHDRFVFTSTTS
jgi:Polysaccharide biosynthesis protein